MIILLVIICFFLALKALLYKMSMLAILEYYVEQGAEHTRKRANSRISNESTKEMATYQRLK